MTAEQPATRLERAVHEFVSGEYQTVTLGPSRIEETYAIVPLRTINSLRWAIDPERPAPRPFVSFDPAMKGGRPTINGVRLEASQIAEHVWSDWTEEQLRDGWSLTRGDILTACWFWAEHGGRKWKQRWGPWAKSMFPLLHRGESYDGIDWPPTAMGGAS